MCYNAHVTKVFLEKNVPYLLPIEHDLTVFEAYIGAQRSCGLQLFVSSNYGSMMHTDVDSSEFTLAYVSNQDVIECPTITVDFILDGAIIPCGDGELFSFRASDSHGTTFRQRTSHVSLVACATLNTNFANVRCRRLKDA